MSEKKSLWWGVNEVVRDLARTKADVWKGRGIVWRHAERRSLDDEGTRMGDWSGITELNGIQYFAGVVSTQGMGQVPGLLRTAGCKGHARRTEMSKEGISNRPRRAAGSQDEHRRPMERAAVRIERLKKPFSVGVVAPKRAVGVKSECIYRAYGFSVPGDPVYERYHKLFIGVSYVRAQCTQRAQAFYSRWELRSSDTTGEVYMLQAERLKGSVVNHRGERMRHRVTEEDDKRRSLAPPFISFPLSPHPLATWVFAGAA